MSKNGNNNRKVLKEKREEKQVKRAICITMIILIVLGLAMIIAFSLLGQNW